MKTARPLPPVASKPPRKHATASVVNDIHSKLNATQVAEVASPATVSEVQNLVHRARHNHHPISIAGGRHAMGGQQFSHQSLHLDTRQLNQVLSFNPQCGLVEVEAGIQWPELVDWLVNTQAGSPHPWGISQKQTGADRLCLGGALSANIHGRGLTLKPFINDIESFRIVTASGKLLDCSRSQNPDLFRLAVGGYGLFGIVTTITLRLTRRTKLQRVVRILDADDVIPAFDQRIADGFLYGDFQFSIDPQSKNFLKRGVFACYTPVDDNTPIPDTQKRLDESTWSDLITLAHTNPAKVYDLYTNFYLETDGQLYWSDTHQLSTYVDDYHAAVDRHPDTSHCSGSEMITEVYVPRSKLPGFLETLAADFRRHAVQIIYGTIRLIEKDDESFLPWAREPWACIVMNLHVNHTPAALAKAENDFRRIIDRAIEFNGSFFLTYHRWATREQIETCHPNFPAFLEEKQVHDPTHLFQSDWHRHHQTLFA